MPAEDGRYVGSPSIVGLANGRYLASHDIFGPKSTFSRTRVFETLAGWGLTFDKRPQSRELTTPDRFEALFPGSAGSLYGLSPHGMTAALQKPTARSAVPGLYLAGGGTHPGAGIPMAALSGRHAAEAILTDLASTLRSRRTATRGGMSTESAIAAPVPSRSSVS